MIWSEFVQEEWQQEEGVIPQVFEDDEHGVNALLLSDLSSLELLELFLGCYFLYVTYVSKYVHMILHKPFNSGLQIQAHSSSQKSSIPVHEFEPP